MSAGAVDEDPTSLTPSKRRLHHQRTRAGDAASLLHLFHADAESPSKLPILSNRLHGPPSANARTSPPRSRKTSQRASSATLVESVAASRSNSRSPSSSPLNTTRRTSAGSIYPGSMGRNHDRSSVWTDSSTLHPGIEDAYHQKVYADRHYASHPAPDPKYFDVRPAVGAHMGIDVASSSDTSANTNRCSVAESSYCSSMSSSIPSSALSPYTPSSIDSQRHEDLFAHVNGQRHSMPPIMASARNGRQCPSPQYASDEDETTSVECQEANFALDAALSSTMKALEAANALLISTMSSRTNLARLRAAETSLDDLMSDREMELLGQIESNRQMADRMDRICEELSEMATSFSPLSSPPSLRPSTFAGKQSWGPASTGLTTAEARVSVDPKLGGIVEALDENATVGKTAAKRLERMLKSDGDAEYITRKSSASSSSAGPGTAPAAKAQDAKSLLSSLAASNGRSEDPDRDANGSGQRRPPSQRSNHSQASVTRGATATHRSSPSAPILGLMNASATASTSTSSTSGSFTESVSGGVSRPPLTRDRSSLSQAFGLDEEGGTSDRAISPVTPASRNLDLPAMDGNDAQSRSSASGTGTPGPSVLLHSRKPSYTHARSPSVIKPSTASSALVSPGLADWNEWAMDGHHHSTRSSPPTESDLHREGGLPGARGQGALAALKMLNAQTKGNGGASVVESSSSSSSTTAHTEPRRAKSSPRLRNVGFEHPSPSPRVPDLPTIPEPSVKRKMSLSLMNTTGGGGGGGGGAERQQTHPKEPTAATATTHSSNARSWSLSGWMKFTGGGASAIETTSSEALPTATTTIPTSTSTHTIVEHDAVDTTK